MLNRNQPGWNQQVSKGELKMQNQDLTKWLEMVWGALDEQDELKRDRLLHAADMFLQDENQDADSAVPSLDRQNTAA
jgi:hypothetical protein